MNDIIDLKMVPKFTLFFQGVYYRYRELYRYR